jgi:hypothetical protein
VRLPKTDRLLQVKPAENALSIVREVHKLLGHSGWKSTWISVRLRWEYPLFSPLGAQNRQSMADSSLDLEPALSPTSSEMDLEVEEGEVRQGQRPSPLTTPTHHPHSPPPNQHPKPPPVMSLTGRRRSYIPTQSPRFQHQIKFPNYR